MGSRLHPFCIAVCAVIALAMAGLAASADSREQPAPAPEPPVRLDDVLVIGKRDEFTKLDLRLRDTKDALPCIGCGGRLLTRTPAAFQFTLDAATVALKVFFQQPRVRGEPNDEALFLALRSANCSGDIGTSRCPNLLPSPKLMNWTADPAGGDSQFEFPRR